MCLLLEEKRSVPKHDGSTGRILGLNRDEAAHDIKRRAMLPASCRESGSLSHPLDMFAELSLVVTLAQLQ